MNKIFFVLISLISLSMADVHPGLKNAIDNGKIKDAKALIEKVGVKDIYCPSSLSLENALKVYGKIFAEKPFKMWEKCDAEFIEKAELEVCKVSASLCKYYIRNGNWDIFKKGLQDVYQSKLYIKRSKGKTVNPFVYEIDLFGLNLLNELKNPFSFDSTSLVLYKLLKKNSAIDYSSEIELANDIAYAHQLGKKANVSICVACSVYPNFASYLSEIAFGNVLGPLLSDDISCDDLLKQNCGSVLYSLNLSKSDLINNITSVYARKGNIPDSLLALSCHLYPKIDKDVNKSLGLDVFSCTMMSEFNKANDFCLKSDSSYIWKSSTNHGYVCENRAWRETSPIENEVGKLCLEKNDGLFYDAYVCEYGKWRMQTAGENFTGKLCKSDYQGVMDGGYVCDSGDWRNATAEELKTKKMCEEMNNGEIIDGYLCENNHWEKASPEDSATNKLCKKNNQGEFIGKYVCDNEKWRESSLPEKKTKKVCGKNDKNEILGDFVCNNSEWRYATQGEKRTKKICTLSNKGEKKDGFYCDKFAGWIKDRNYGTMQDPRDGKKYRTTMIGKQEWMAENINFKPQEPSKPNLSYYWETYCYDGKEENCRLNGRLYPPSTAMQNACPEGWKIPSIEDVREMIEFIGGWKNAGKKLKIQAAGGTDEYGFSAIPSGYWTIGPYYMDDRYAGFF